MMSQVMPKKKSATKKKTAKKPVVKKPTGKAPGLPGGEEHLARVRRLCLAMPDSWEKLSHGAPAFFVRNRSYCMFMNNHHYDGHLAVWIAATHGLQAELVTTEPKKYFRPPYVGVAGWVGVELPAVSDEELSFHLLEAWRMVNDKQKPRRKPLR